MRLNLKQQELLENYIAQLQERFPSIEVQGITPSAEDPADIWVHIFVTDDDPDGAISAFAAEMNIDILVNYGYSISVMIHSGVVEA
ncbi:MAG: hypothetical protein ACOVSW_02725 [Candidatus Kapaibacteriota bacterium]|jgi:hypothetical protein